MNRLSGAPSALDMLTKFRPLKRLPCRNRVDAPLGQHRDDSARRRQETLALEHCVRALPLPRGTGDLRQRPIATVAMNVDKDHFHVTCTLSG